MKLKGTLLLIAALGALPSVSSAAPLDVAAFLKGRGWTAHQNPRPLRMPVADIVPVMYLSRDGGGAPSCGLLSQSGSGTSFIEMLGPDTSGWPQCMGIRDVAAVDIDRKSYLVFELANRDTREDTRTEYFYVYKNAAGVYVADDLDAKPQALFKGKVKGIGEGVRQAKAAMIQRMAGAMALLPRDSIFADSAAYAVFADKGHTKCAFVLQSGPALSRFEHTVFPGADACSDTLATSRFDSRGKTYFMTMFRGLKQKRLAIFSIDKAHVITPEKELATLAAANAPLTDMRSVRMFLLPHLK